MIGMILTLNTREKLKLSHEREPKSMSQFASKRYISLETSKRNGESVRTPVWFVEENQRLFVWTAYNSGKAKRIRNNPKIRIAPCSATGKPTGTWINGEARIVSEAEVGHATELFKKKYTLQFWVIARLNKSKRALIELHTE